MDEKTKQLVEFNQILERPKVNIPAVGCEYRYNGSTYVCSELRVYYDDRYPDCATTLEVKAVYTRRYNNGETD